jgi:hypothetical protein
MAGLYANYRQRAEGNMLNEKSTLSLTSGFILLAATFLSSNIAGCASSATTENDVNEETPDTSVDGVGKKTYIDGLIIRPETMVYGGYKANVPLVVAGAKQVGAKKLYIEIRAVDANEPGQKGTLYYDPVSPKILGEKVYTYKVAGKATKFDNTYLADLIKAAHKEKIAVHAWLAAFNNPLYFATHAAEGAKPNDNAKEMFVSPACDGYGSAVTALVDDIVSTFDFDGVTLDYTRYTDDRQPQDACAIADYKSQFGAAADLVSDSKVPGPKRDQFLNFRAKYITDLYSTLSTRLAKKKIALSGFLMPHSAVAKPDGHSAYFASSWSGVNYEELAKLPIQLMPMLYWSQQTSEGITTPWEKDFSKTWQEYVTAVNKNVATWTNHQKDRFAPVYSLEKTNAELIEAMKLSRAQGVYGVTLFYSGTWQKLAGRVGAASIRKFDRVATVLAAVNK